MDSVVVRLPCGHRGTVLSGCLKCTTKTLNSISPVVVLPDKYAQADKMVGKYRGFKIFWRTDRVNDSHIYWLCIHSTRKIWHIKRRGLIKEINMEEYTSEEFSTKIYEHFKKWEPGVQMLYMNRNKDPVRALFSDSYRHLYFDDTLYKPFGKKLSRLILPPFFCIGGSI